MKTILLNKDTWAKPLLMMAFVGLLLPAFAQNCGGGGGNANMQEKKEKIKALKVAYLTNKLSLTPDEAEKFWPVYNEYQDKLMQLRYDKMKEARNVQDNLDAMSDDDVAAYLDNRMKSKKEELDLETEYMNKIRKVLPIRKVALLIQAEHDFRSEIMHQYKNSHGDGGPENHGGPQPGNNGNKKP